MALVQARYGSSRLPGKVLSDLNGRPLLGWVLDRLKRCKTLSIIVVVTSYEESDNPIVEFCQSEGTNIFRGPLSNVAQRFCNAVDKFQSDAFVRVSADSPMIDPSIVDQAVEMFGSGMYDLVTNVQTRTFPKGQSVEVLNTNTFFRTVKLINTPYDQEHVTSFYYKNPEMFRISNFESGADLGDLQLSIDTEEDFSIMKQLMARVDPNVATWQELAAELRVIKGMHALAG